MAPEYERWFFSKDARSGAGGAAILNHSQKNHSFAIMNTDAGSALSV